MWRTHYDAMAAKFDDARYVAELARVHSEDASASRGPAGAGEASLLFFGLLFHEADAQLRGDMEKWLAAATN